MGCPLPSGRAASSRRAPGSLPIAAPPPINFISIFPQALLLQQHIPLIVVSLPATSAARRYSSRHRDGSRWPCGTSGGGFRGGDGAGGRGAALVVHLPQARVQGFEGGAGEGNGQAGGGQGRRGRKLQEAGGTPAEVERGDGQACGLKQLEVRRHGARAQPAPGGARHRRRRCRQPCWCGALALPGHPLPRRSAQGSHSPWCVCRRRCCWFPASSC